MTSRASNLLSPLVIANGIKLKNRVVLAPMTRARSGISRVPNALVAEYYVQRASAGLLITEAVSISEEANGWRNTPGIYSPQMVEGWKAVVDAVHAANGVIACQLWHTGRQSHSSFQVGGALPVAPSAVVANGAGIKAADGETHPYETPRALDLEEIPRLVNDYREAARNALAAGFDMIELHGANGYILDQFLQSRTNHRTDAYGGSKENRFRLIQEVVEAVYEIYPPSSVGIRLSPNGAVGDMGSEDNDETFLYAAAELAKLKIGYIHLVDGTAFGVHGRCRTLTLTDFRKVYDGVVIGSLGYSRDTAEGAIHSGAADLIAFGRAFIANPDLVERFANDWPLASPNPATFYSFEPEGYTDYSTYQQPAIAAEA